MPKVKKPSSKSTSTPSTSTLSPSDQQKLPLKLQNIFDRNIIQGYEDDKYESTISECDKILLEYPEHGETLCMKGLCIYTLGKKKYGKQLIKKGLKNNLKSSISWRVKALFHRNEREYDESIKCYKQSLHYDKNNIRIQNDLSILLLQIKKFNQYNKIREELWKSQRDQTNAVGYLISLYLSGNYEDGLLFLDRFLGDYSENIAKFDCVQFNEILLLKIKFMLKLKKYEDIIKFIDVKIKNKQIKDVLYINKVKLFIYNKILNDNNNSLNILNKLIDINPENANNHRLYLKIKFPNLDDEKSENEIIKYFDSLKKKYPRCQTLDRILLDITTGDLFKKLIDKYLIKKFNKSVISLYNDIKSLYSNNNKSIIINSLLTEYTTELTKNNRYHTTDKPYSASPSCILWVNYYNAIRLLDINQYTTALNIVNKMIDIIPTCVDLYLLKAKIYKHSGNAKQAFNYLNYSRKMDTADRFLNTKCVRYALRSLLINDAENIVRLFLKKNEGTKNLDNLQVIWYELHKSESHYELEEYGCCLRQLELVFNHYNIFWDNQKDFHNYAYRKVSIGSFISLLKWEWKLRYHPFFIRAAKLGIKVWMEVSEISELDVFKKGSTPQDKDDEKNHRIDDARGYNLLFDIQDNKNIKNEDIKINKEYCLSKANEFMIEIDNISNLMNNNDYIYFNILKINLLYLKNEYNDMFNVISLIIPNIDNNNHKDNNINNNESKQDDIDTNLFIDDFDEGIKIERKILTISELLTNYYELLSILILIITNIKDEIYKNKILKLKTILFGENITNIKEFLINHLKNGKYFNQFNGLLLLINKLNIDYITENDIINGIKKIENKNVVDCVKTVKLCNKYCKNKDIVKELVIDIQKIFPLFDV